MNYASDVLKRFWSKTTTDHDFWFEGTKCIIWTGAVNNKRGTKRYGKFHVGFMDGKRVTAVASRFAYALVHGEVDPQLEVDHRCRRTLCVNELHLEAVTGCENRRRAERHRLHQLTCPQGHLWSRENMQIAKIPGRSETRRCAQCNRDKTAAWVAEKSTTPLAKRTLDDLTPACRNGHSRTPENTRFSKYGAVSCLDCNRDAVARWKAKKTA